MTDEQLAQLYQAANQANSDLAAAYRSKDRTMIGMLRDRSRELNSAYADAKRHRKRQQKADNKSQQLTQMIRFYMDQPCNAQT